MVVNFYRSLRIVSVFSVATVMLNANLAVGDVINERNQALREQHSRINELISSRNQTTLLSANRATDSSLLLQNSSSTAAAFQTTNSPGVIKLSKDSAINQQLRQGMNNARSGLKEIKALRQDPVAQEQQRIVTASALTQAVEAYLACRSEAKVPISAHHEQDPFLREMIVIKQMLTKKHLHLAAANEMLDRLSTARNILVTLSEAR